MKRSQKIEPLFNICGKEKNKKTNDEKLKTGCQLSKKLVKIKLRFAVFYNVVHQAF